MYKKTCIVILLLLLSTLGGYYAHRQHNTPPGGLIRLHVIANSNSFYDQDLKIQVKDRIIRETAPLFSRAASIAEAREIADACAKKIESVALEEVRRRGFDYPVRVMRGTFYFPAKTYPVEKHGRVTTLALPPGEYEAVRVIIGEGNGANWWCVLYPPLCFVDLAQSIPPAALPAASAVEKKNGDNAELGGAGPGLPRVEYRFRAFEITKSIFNSK